MKNKRKLYLFSAVMALLMLLCMMLGTYVMAQQPPLPQPAPPMTFLVADGSSSGTYAEFLKEMQAQDNIGAVVTFKEVPSSGAVQNLDLLLTNKVSAAFMHSDVLYYNAQTRDLSKFQTLLALHREDVHFLALTVSKRTTGGTFGYGAKPIQINSVEDLKGLRVGASGGGWITANVINQMAQLGYTVVPSYNSGQEVIDALTRGDIDAAEFTGGAPLPIIGGDDKHVALGPDYKLLPIPDRDVQMLRGQYVPTTISYPAMRPDTINTVAARCLFVGRVYTVTKFVKMLHDFRAAFVSDLPTLQQTPGMHPKWGEVDITDHGPWHWMDLGDSSTLPKAPDQPPPQ